MPLVYAFSLVNASKDLSWEEVLRYSHGCLHEDEDVCDQAHDCMRRLESGFWMRGLVDLDDDEGGDEAEVCDCEDTKVS